MPYMLSNWGILFSVFLSPCGEMSNRLANIDEFAPFSVFALPDDLPRACGATRADQFSVYWLSNHCLRLISIASTILFLWTYCGKPGEQFLQPNFSSTEGDAASRV